MKRKVVKQGPATLMVSLPSKWVKKNNVSAGDEIEVLEDVGEIVISVNKTKKSKEIELTLNHTDRLVKSIIGTLYKNGYTSIKIHSNNPKTIEIIRSRIHTKVGFEIIELKKNYCYIKNIAEITDGNFDDVLSRYFNTLLTIAKESTEPENDISYDNYYDLLSKLQLVCLRNLNSNSHEKSETIANKSIIIRNTLFIGREILDIIKLFSSHGKNEKLQKILKEISSMMSFMCSVYQKYDEDKLNELSEDCEKTISNIEKENNIDSVIKNKLYFIVKKISETVGPMVTLHIENDVLNNKYTSA